MKHPFVKLTLAIIIGLLVANIVIYGIESFNLFFYNPQTPLKTREQMNAYIKNAPLIVKFILLFSYMIGSFVGGYVAARISSKEYKILNAMIVAALLLLGAVINFLTFKHDAWVTILCLAAFPICCYYGAKLAVYFSAKATTNE